jgi:hypothetical protein
MTRRECSLKALSSRHHYLVTSDMMFLDPARSIPAALAPQAGDTARHAMARVGLSALSAVASHGPSAAFLPQLRATAENDDVDRPAGDRERIAGDEAVHVVDDEPEIVGGGPATSSVAFDRDGRQVKPPRRRTAAPSPTSFDETFRAAIDLSKAARSPGALAVPAAPRRVLGEFAPRARQRARRHAEP